MLEDSCLSNGKPVPFKWISLVNIVVGGTEDIYSKDCTSFGREILGDERHCALYSCSPGVIPLPKFDISPLRMGIEIRENPFPESSESPKCYGNFDLKLAIISKRNFAPVEEFGGPAVISSIEGNIPDDFPEGVYIRNGPNPLVGGLKSTKSVFGKSNHICVEGEGMLHALYNVFMDFPLTIDVKRLFLGGPLVKYIKESYARIGVMPRYGDTDSIKWFSVEPNCTIHLLNCFDDGDDEVVVWGCRALDSVIPGPYDPSSKANFDAKIGKGALYDRPYEWRLNMRTGDVQERNLTVDTEMSMDFPVINGNLTGLKNKFGYTQVLDVMATSTANHFPKYGGLAKLHFEELETRLSSVYVIDAKKFSDKPVSKITLPCRVPYGFHGALIPMS
ncbi:hypothetical protein TIFTF001_009198 [Ficus carica]|uniref:Carotenoid oxygenase n=1 Tax=Ficus carica TaxID=3494 RepID=A0AA88D3E9_FICCA|nr:hypothetical protein TIFTF001_009198 [Ficus carica]